MADALARLNPDLVLLQEVDVGARRTGRVDVAALLAARLQLNSLFAAEFVELGQGTPRRPAYHGQAVLTALPVSATRVVRFSRQTGYWKPRWYLPNWAFLQRRIGGRLALAVELGAVPHRLVAYNVHLESRGPEALRLSQIEDVIADARRYPETMPILLAGDLNTRTQDSPVVRALLEAGFRQAAGRQITTTRGAALDWVFVRGPLRSAGDEVHAQVRASDHFPVTVRITHEAPGAGQFQPATSETSVVPPSRTPSSTAIGPIGVGW